MRKVTVDGVDTVAAMMSETMRTLSDSGKGTSLLARSFDLKSAYRQLAIADDSIQWARICAYNPKERKSECCQQYSMPFGGRASVVSFIRCWRALQRLAHQLLIIVSCYSDDYVCTSPDELAGNAASSFGLLLELLGWEYDREGSKADTMSNRVTSLGVVFGLQASCSGLVHVSNTDSRKEEITQKLDEVISSRFLRKAETAKLKGRLTFAEGHLFGRSARACFNSLTRHLFQHPLDSRLSEDCLADLGIFRASLEKARPRCVDINVRETLYLFTDAHYEQRAGGLGAVLYDDAGRVVAWFGHGLSTEDCSGLNINDSDQIITELEALGVLASLRLWRSRLKGRHVLAFVDNEGARGAILRGRSPNRILHQVAHEVAKEEEQGGIICWYSGVRSFSNPADAPSRLIPAPSLPLALRANLTSAAWRLQP